ncbi:PIG-L deacetylase family protein [Bartonella tamiae]|uniref:LmbE family protein n=1 Tax=Bartonella tamiae Th239 TaxID=1094558 RepID=J0QX28_9HYPH|nr:PIG-L family deacetylase [Bartonella tamiae]EJF90596.1 hypothetical protein ME5_00997 [Bartonella tamiae Th239]EJF94026.1 hypothetical protein MEG_00884 [Bartonella tamiae Th307]
MVTPLKKGSLFQMPCHHIHLKDITRGNRLLVLAPHPDDEALGCGGGIAAACAAGMNVDIICITDGSHSHKNSLHWPKDKLVTLRANEFFKSTFILSNGLARNFMLNYEDQNSPNLISEIELAAMHIKKRLAPFYPTTIWSSWIGDPHIDHQNTAHLAYALKRLFSDSVLFFYTVWGRFIETDLLKEKKVLKLNTKPYQKIKEKAVMAHRSQMTRLIDDDPDGFVMSEQTRQHFISEDEYFLEADREYRAF